MTDDRINVPDEENGTRAGIARDLCPIEVVEVEGRRYATQPGLARTLGVTPRTLARWDERRIGPPKIKVGKLVLYDLSKLHAWFERHERAPLTLAHPNRRGRA